VIWTETIMLLQNSPFLCMCYSGHPRNFAYICT